MAPPAALDQSLVEAFASDGAVCVRGAFSREELALVERGIERNLAAPSPRAFAAAAGELPAGAPMDHPLFPVLWEREPGGG
jgi:hypothetical protein